MKSRPPSHSLSLSRKALPSILCRIKEGYLLWLNLVPHIPKTSRFTIGQRIENKFLDLLEFTHTAYYSTQDQKKDRVIKCILTLDTLKFLTLIAWEAKLIPNGKYTELSEKLIEAGRMLGGWRKNLDNPGRKNRDL